MEQKAEGKADRELVRFRYTFRFDDGQEQAVQLALDPVNLTLLEPVREEGSQWTSLGFCQVEACPRRSADRPTCPATMGLEGVLNFFGKRPSSEQVQVIIDAESRSYTKRTTIQQAVTSLVGIFMVTSGCPVLGKLKPMVRYHLPFATLEETQYRAISMYLLAQYFRSRQGKKPDWKLQDLVTMYKEIQSVNDYFVQRLSKTDTQGAGVNALVVLQAFSYAIAFSIDRDMLEEIELLFKSYIEANH
jgi:hypothetical protein